MRSMSLEKTRQREVELAQEIDRLQMEIKTLQKNSEEAANVNQQLSKEVKDVEDQLSQRKAEVEKLIQEMREVNMESLAISPPEESKQFLDGNLSHSTINWIIKTAINELTSFFSLFLSFFFLLTMQLMSTVALVKKALNIILEFPSSRRKLRDFTNFLQNCEKKQKLYNFFREINLQCFQGSFEKQKKIVISGLFKLSRNLHDFTGKKSMS